MKKVAVTFLTILVFACTDNTIPVDCSLSGLALDLVSTSNASGCGMPDGTITISASGGVGPYEFAILNMNAKPNGVFTNLEPGVYSFTVRDKNNCEAVLNNVLLMGDNFAYSVDITPNTKCVGGNGSFSIDMLEGEAPYQFKLGDGAFENSNVFSGLETGNYTITVKDKVNCTAAINIVIPQGATNTSWSSEILPIMQTACAVTGCHNGVVRSDLRIYANAKANSALIKTYTQNGYMPFEGTITQAQKDLFACWVDEGALEN